MTRLSRLAELGTSAWPGVADTMPPATLAVFRDHGSPADALTAASMCDLLAGLAAPALHA